MTHFDDRVTVIIRSVGERTEQLCRELILAQGVSSDNVVIVREAPFSAALRRSFEIGIESGRPWTLCVDADLLLRPGSVKMMLQLAEEQEENVCEIQGYVLDKFFAGPRYGGVHLYRTRHLPLALSKIPSEGVDIRPESHLLRLMSLEGYPRATVPYLGGLHDFEQFNRDIFRKCFVHAHKHVKYSDLFLSIWREKAENDKDYWIALQGFAQGIAYTGDVFIDVQQDIYRVLFDKLQLNEKQPLALDEPFYVEPVIRNWIEPEPYQTRFPTKYGLVLPVKESASLKEKFGTRMSSMGPVRIIPYSVGWLIRTLGSGLQSWVGR